MRARTTLVAGMLAAALIPGTLCASAPAETSSPVDDQGSSVHYRSEIRSLQPAVSGLSVQVLQFADRLQLVNHTGRVVTVYGYEGEAYLRVQPSGAVEQNTRSPATYLNESFFGDINVPPQADAKAAPSWRVLDRTGQVEWHDHRIHYTSPAVPPQVKDQGKRTLVFDWRVPISVGSRRGAIAGQLFWVPNSSKAPLGAIIAGVAIVLLGGAVVVLSRRRRGPSGRPPAGAAAGPPDGPGPDAEEGSKPPREAW